MISLSAIVYEDNDLLIVDKPQGLATTPGKSEDLCTLIFKMRPDLKNVTGHKENEGGLLNRLDNETGGLVIFAKNDSAFCHYNELLKTETITKEYLALVRGTPAQNNGYIKTPIAHHYSDPSRMVTTTNGKYRSTPQHAETGYRVLSSDSFYSLLHVTIRKGVRHQIRVHLASIGTPIAGDKLYNKIKTSEFSYQMLFAYALTIPLASGEQIRIKRIPDCIQQHYPNLRID